MKININSQPQWSQLKDDYIFFGKRYLLDKGFVIANVEVKKTRFSWFKRIYERMADEIRRSAPSGLDF